MFLKLVTDAPCPDEDAALGALDAVRVMCALGGVEPLMAWRDHLVLEAWRSRWCPDEMVSAAERDGAVLWESALVATRQALKLPLNARLDIEVVFTGATPVVAQHGPDRFLWRRHWAWRVTEWACAPLTDVNRLQARDRPNGASGSTP